MPAGQTKIGVSGEFKVVSRNFSTHPHTPVFSSKIIVKEGISTVHPVTLVLTYSGTNIYCVAAVFIANTKLSKQE
ncbi:hypothetical protein DJ55_4037 [Yersinia pseudotuberculosis]|nr:hypothetical protein DJ55_4037 [Yersinia pseudotuberculosis]